MFSRDVTSTNPNFRRRVSSSRRDKRAFTRSGSKIRVENIAGMPMRGGIRL